MSEMTRQQAQEAGQFEVLIDDFGYCGEGYVRLADGWLSVPGALPGETVRVAVDEGQSKRARRIYAQVVDVIEASPQRRDPLCDRDAYCRGCQLRHLTIDGELKFKVRTVREVMDRYADLAVEDQPTVEIVTPQPIARGDAFRIRSTLTYQRRGDTFELGLRTPVRDSLVPMFDCPALTRPVRRLVSAVTDSLQAVRGLPWDQAMVDDVRDQVNEIDVALGLRHIAVAAPFYGVGLIDIALTEATDRQHFESQLDGPVLGPWLSQLGQDLPEKVGVSVHSAGFRRHLSGPKRIQIPMERWQLEVGFEDWFHATLEPAEVVYAKMRSWLQWSADDRMLDVGCATGTISLMAGPEVDEVVGIDANPSSIEAAELNAMADGQDNLEFIVGGWEKALRELAMKGEQFSVATINPMREPLGRRALAFLDVLGVRRLVYLGPSPEAAAKDIGQLRQMGWTVEALGAGNLHPATYHTMLMAYLERPPED